MAQDVASLAAWLRRAAGRYAAAQAELNALDQAIGDGDHGANLARGFAKIVEKLDAAPPADPAALFKLAGMTLIGTVGGAAGPLYGSFFLDMAKAAGGAATLDAAALARCLAAGVAGVAARGKAVPGDKTMLDALMPAIAALDGGASLAEAAAAAHAGVAATIPIVARKGRASYLGERAIGHADPGATSAAMLLDALAVAETPA
ncbi:dihydroxyacetone kinase subunit DhaL [Acidiphilium sp.]|uniref:dihydroxyacetone kinase subunit DhaL n=1 Tax=Acidiphilium sp. TaxID=527 RepID=UPI003D03EEF0